MGDGANQGCREQVLALLRRSDTTGRDAIKRGHLKDLITKVLDPCMPQPLQRQLSCLLDTMADRDTDTIDNERFMDWVYGETGTPAPSPPPKLLNTDRSTSSVNPWTFAKAVTLMRSAEESILLGVSIAFLETEFLAEVDSKFGPDSDPDYYTITARMLTGPEARGSGMLCPRDGLPGCSYADALDARHTGPATVMLSWTWQYTVRVVVGALAKWCRQSKRNPPETFVWQCALCNNQFRVEDKKARNESEPFEVFRSVFEARVKCTRHILALLLPWHQPVYIQRIWCVFELWAAANTENCKLELVLSEQAEKDFKADLARDGMTGVWKVLGKVQIQHAEATVMADRENILRLVDPEVQTPEDCECSTKIKSLNSAVVKQLQSWCVNTASAYLESQLQTGEQVSPQMSANVAWLLMEVEDWSRAMAVLNTAAADLEARGTTDTVEYAWLMKSRGSCEAYQGNYAEALRHYSAAKTIFKNGGKARTLAYARLLRNMGKCQTNKGCYSEAMELFTDAQQAYEAAGATGTPNYAVLLRSIGTCLIDLCRLEEASDYLSQAKRAFEAIGSSTTPSYAGALMDLAVCEDRMGHSKEAMDLFLMAKAILDRTGYTESHHYAILMRFMACCYDRQGRFAEAIELFNKAKTTFELSGVAKTTNYAALLVDMATCHTAHGNSDNAAELFDLAKDIYEAADATDKPGYAQMMALNSSLPFFNTLGGTFQGRRTSDGPLCQFST